MVKRRWASGRSSTFDSKSGQVVRGPTVRGLTLLPAHDLRLAVMPRAVSRRAGQARRRKKLHHVGLRVVQDHSQGESRQRRRRIRSDSSTRRSTDPKRRATEAAVTHARSSQRALAAYDRQLASYTRCVRTFDPSLSNAGCGNRTHPANSTRIWFRYLLRPWKSAQHHRRPGGRDCGRSPSAADYRAGHRPIA